MKIRDLGLAAALIVLMGGLALGNGGVNVSPDHRSSVFPSAPSLEFPPLFASPFPLTSTSQRRGLPQSGPQPVNLLSVGFYQNNNPNSNSGVGYLAFGDFNGD